MTHQHWVQQVITAGGFNVHCTQAAEASHKINMHLSSLRVRHSDINGTQNAMLQYLCKRVLFQELKHSLFPPVAAKENNRRVVFSHVLEIEYTRTQANIMRFLHKDVRIVEFELGHMIANEFRLQRDQLQDQLRPLTFFFSQKYVREDGRTLWATPNRRDIFRIKGQEGGTTLCAEAICFIQVSNLRAIDRAGVISPNNRDLVLIRWLSPHPDSVERDETHRPVCPGPLRINNCLWQYSRADEPRRCMGRQFFRRQRQLFGDREEDQNNVRAHELHAWYGLVKPVNVEETMNMCPVFKPGSSEWDGQVWLQTVTMC